METISTDIFRNLDSELGEIESQSDETLSKAINRWNEFKQASGASSRFSLPNYNGR